MGRTVDTWRAQVLTLLRDEAGIDFQPVDVDEAGLRPAFAEHSRRRPFERVTEVAGNGTAYYALPTGWIPDVSVLYEVEYPARQSPRQILPYGSWEVTRSSTDVTTRMILLDRSPSASQFVRFTFGGSWPFPDDLAATDQIPDLHFEAVAALAASKCCVSLASKAARHRDAALPTDLADGTRRVPELLSAAETFKQQYDSVCPRFPVVA